MIANRSDIFIFANHEIHAFLSRADGLVHGTNDVSAGDLHSLGQLLASMAPEMSSEALADVSEDAGLQEQIQRYISNLRSLQGVLEQVRCVMLARRAKLDVARQHIDGVQGWANAYRQIA